MNKKVLVSLAAIGLSVSLFFYSCEQPERLSFSQDQKRFQEFINNSIEQVKNYNVATSVLTKEEWSDSVLSSVNDFLADSMNNKLPSFLVEVGKIEVMEIGGVKAFIAKFNDASYNEYWMEYDYMPDSIANLQNNPAYLLVKDFNQGAKVRLDFVKKGKAEWHSDRLYPLGIDIRVEVVSVGKP